MCEFANCSSAKKTAGSSGEGASLGILLARANSVQAHADVRELKCTISESRQSGLMQMQRVRIYCHDRFLPVSHWFKVRLRVDEAASRGGCRGCAATRCRSEWMRECPTRGKVPCRVREVFSTGFGSEASCHGLTGSPSALMGGVLKRGHDGSRGGRDSS